MQSIDLLTSRIAVHLCAVGPELYMIITFFQGSRRAERVVEHGAIGCAEHGAIGRVEHGAIRCAELRRLSRALRPGVMKIDGLFLGLEEFPPEYKQFIHSGYTGRSLI